MPRKVEIRQDRTVRTYARLRAVSWYSLKLAKDTEYGRFLHLMTSMVFSAFCLEAFLNHVGQEKISYWKLLKRKLGPAEKLEVISLALNVVPDDSKRPFQTFKEIFKFRDLLVHAETYRLDVTGEYFLEDDESPPEPLAPWEENISIINAERFLDDSKGIIYKISEAAGYDIPSVLMIEDGTTIQKSFGLNSIVSS